MSREELIKKIKSRGYWKVQFQPFKFKKNAVERKKLLEIVGKSTVKLRGWDYPHFSHWDDPSNRQAVLGANFIEGGSDWDVQIEFWRMYESCQFVHLFAMDEDWWQESGFYSDSRYKGIKPGEVFNIISGLYTIFEIFEFAHRLAKSGVFGEGVTICISLNNTQGRKLKIMDFMRGPLFGDYKSHEKNITFKKEFSIEELINEHKKLSIDTAIWIFESFNWLDSPREVFEKDQKNLYDRRM